MYVATAEGQSSILTVSAGVPQGAIWSPLLFNLYIQFLPSVVRFSSVIGYANDHTLLKIIPQKLEDHLGAADELNTDLEALFQFGQQWFMDFAPLKTKALLISLKRDILDHTPLSRITVQLLRYHRLKFWASCLTLLLHGGLI